MRFLIDAQLPPVPCRLSTAAGHNCEHVEQVGLLRADDPDIWNYAARMQAVIVTKDEDFPNLRMLNPSGPQLVWLRVGNCSNRALLAWFSPLLQDVIDRLKSGEGLIEVV